jgi:hypothetical protein
MAEAMLDGPSALAASWLSTDILSYRTSSEGNI